MAKFGDFIKWGFLISILVLIVTAIFKMILTPDLQLFIVPYTALVSIVVISVGFIVWTRQKPIVSLFKKEDHEKYYREHVMKLLQYGMPITANVNDGTNTVNGFDPDINTIIGNFHVLRFFDESNPIKKRTRIMLYYIPSKTSFGEFKGSKINPDPSLAIEQLARLLPQMESGHPLTIAIQPAVSVVKHIEEKTDQNSGQQTG